MLVPKTLDDLNQLVTEELEESVRLEFKRQLPPSGQNEDVAKDISALANTDGGIILYGIAEENRRASKLFPFDLKGTVDRVNLIAESLDDPVHLKQSFSIASQESQDLGFLIVEVERSERAPHVFNGTVWGRTPRGNVTLTRRQIGERFARQPGFAEEFGLALRPPGRLAFVTVRDDGFFFLFSNDGDSDIFDATWKWEGEDLDNKSLPKPLNDPFPVKSLPPGGELRMHVIASLSDNVDGLLVRTSWSDSNGNQSSIVWPVTWV